MNKSTFPLLATIVALPLLGSLTLLQEDALPLLTRLFIAEFGMIVTAIGAYLGARTLLANGFAAILATAATACVFMFIKFIMIGAALWPSMSNTAS